MKKKVYFINNSVINQFFLENDSFGKSELLVGGLKSQEKKTFKNLIKIKKWQNLSNEMCIYLNLNFHLIYEFNINYFFFSLFFLILEKREP